MVQTTAIEYGTDELTLIGHLALPDGNDRRPGVLVAHEGFGLDDHARRRAERLAELGYVAFALDYHGGGVPMTDREQVMTRIRGLMAEPEQTRELAMFGLRVLSAQPRTDRSKVAAIGFCFGGTLVLELARGGADVKAVVGFHSNLATARPHDAHNIKGKVLVCIGADDPMIAPHQRQSFEEEMREGGVDWRMNLYGGAVHSFTNPSADERGMPGLAYHRPTDERSWRAMLDLFDEVFAEPT